MASNASPTASQLLKNQRESAVFGITRWYTRFQLPNAKKSPIFVQPIADITAVVTDSTTDSTQAKPRDKALAPPLGTADTSSIPNATIKPRSVRPPAPNLDVEKVTTDSQPIPTDSQPSTGEQAILNRPCPPFTLWVIQAGSVLLIDSIGANIDSLTQSMMMRLAQGIISEASGEQVELQVRQFQWPLFDHQYAPRDEISAKRMFNEFLQESVSVQGIKTLLLCGDTAVRYTHTEADGVLVLSDQTRLQAVVGPRLSSLLYSAADKRSLWSHIRAAC